MGQGPRGISALVRPQNRSASSCRKSETDAACGLNDAGSDFQQSQPDGGELGRCQIARLWDGVMNGEDEPIGGGVGDEANLIGERRAATGAVRRQAGSCAA